MNSGTRVVINNADLRNLARRRLPAAAFDFLEGGAEDEFTLFENRAAFERVRFRPRYGIDVSTVDIKTTLLGREIAWPAFVAPIGCSHLFHRDGDLGGARATGMMGIGFCLSTMSIYTLEQVKKCTSGPIWYQLYFLGGRKTAEASIGRAREAGFDALMITMDTAIAGLREREIRSGTYELLGNAMLPKLRHLPNVVAHPGWLVGYLRTVNRGKLPNIINPETGPLGMTDVPSALQKSAVTWEDLEWVRDLWKGPIVVKGILTVEDARRAIDAGAAALVVSNHGGRQLDHAVSSLNALGQIVREVGNRVTVLIDGGIRSGSDVIKSLCFGAKGVLLGRTYAYGLAADGEKGAIMALEMIRTGMIRTMKLLGTRKISDLSAEYLDLMNNNR